ncbi:ribosomal protein S5 domain 2-type protein [Zychaea mexicana]|uniref:ribosomal protein S5 domain 2-type protein n=1 Tax=Zychaea mexicana TaxID=64656 RepID=UPI0022FECCE5|nr:ribosomal protein S5 domain 2-type protein [Zychaea mexicana]KAI9490158.1 ribosomal protein S5 domain 2-type protein [Zychaea mexicana]
MTAAINTTVVSAPGKVLMTGGYLVLDQAYRGLVVGTTARFYTAIQPIQDEQGTIEVRSPQFDVDASWSYTASVEDGKLHFSARPGSSQNKFVETCLKFTLEVIYQRTGTLFTSNGGLSITIVGDNDFYSQRAQLESRKLPNTAESLASLEPFCSTHATLKTVHKTGLGSSAALTTSLVTALFVHLSASDLEQDRTLIHNVAQYVHCFAQGKVGSGFDVSAAVYGNHRYTRFKPDVLSPVMNDQVDPKQLLKALDPATGSWDNAVVPFQLPPGLELLLADVDAGSHTPTLVSKVLAWRKLNPTEANQLWDQLGGMNANVEQHLRNLTSAAESDPEAYKQAIVECAALKASEWHTVANKSSIMQEFAQLAADFGQIRAYLQKMSESSQVPIEPAEQTRLLDACMDVEGVALAGVPGAGGYDAIYCIVLSEKAKESVRKVWSSWTEMSVGPLLAQADNKGIAKASVNSVNGLARFL